MASKADKDRAYAEGYAAALASADRRAPYGDSELAMQWYNGFDSANDD